MCASSNQFEPPSPQSLSVLLSSSSKVYSRLCLSGQMRLLSLRRRRGLYYALGIEDGGCLIRRLCKILQSSPQQRWRLIWKKTACIYFSSSEDRWTYELCLGRHIYKRMICIGIRPSHDGLIPMLVMV